MKSLRLFICFSMLISLTFPALYKADESFLSRLRRHDTDHPNLKSQIVTSSCECRGRKLRPLSSPALRPASMGARLILQSIASGDQLLVQFVEYHAQLIREQLVHFAEAAVLIEWRQFEVIWLDAEVGGDVAADHFEPFDLFRRETVSPFPNPPPQGGRGSLCALSRSSLSS